MLVHVKQVAKHCRLETPGCSPLAGVQRLSDDAHCGWQHLAQAVRVKIDHRAAYQINAMVLGAPVYAVEVHVPVMKVLVLRGAVSLICGSGLRDRGSLYLTLRRFLFSASPNIARSGTGRSASITSCNCGNGQQSFERHDAAVSSRIRIYG